MQAQTAEKAAAHVRTASSQVSTVAASGACACLFEIPASAIIIAYQTATTVRLQAQTAEKAAAHVRTASSQVSTVAASGACACLFEIPASAIIIAYQTATTVRLQAQTAEKVAARVSTVSTVR